MTQRTQNEIEALNQPETIWLSPCCNACVKYVDQLWCTDPQDDCEDCGRCWTRYRIDAEQAREANVPAPQEEEAPDGS